VILVDANLLVYSINRDLPQHARARAWWERVLSGTTIVGLPWVVLQAFWRITTNVRVFSRPLAPEAACAYVDDWLAQPPVRLVVPGVGR